LPIVGRNVRGRRDGSVVVLVSKFKEFLSHFGAGIGRRVGGDSRGLYDVVDDENAGLKKKGREKWCEAKRGPLRTFGPAASAICDRILTCKD
jgi:hypothetical protein